MAIVKQVILASGSPFRQKLLASTGLSFLAQPARCDEKAITHADAQQLAQMRSRAKAFELAAEVPESLVIGCDQTLALGDELFTKAATEGEAGLVLRRLSGKTHHLYSAFSLAYQSRGGERPYLLSDTVVPVPMPMRALEDEELDAYLATGEWRGCVGCYQFENRGVHLFVHQDLPDYTAVIGLPLPALLAELRRLGINGLTAPQGPWRLQVALPARD